MPRVRPIIPVANMSHSLWANRPLIAAFPRRNIAFDDYNRNGWAVTNTITTQSSLYGNAFKFSGGTPGSYFLNTSLVLPTTACTILIVICAPTQANHGATFSDRNNLSSGRLMGFIPYESIVYWEFGGTTAPNDINWTPSASWFGNGIWHCVALRAGTKGMSIWSDGIKVATSSTPVTRTNTTAGFTIGAAHAYSLWGDSIIDSFRLYNTELSDEVIRRWSIDPYEDIRPSNDFSIGRFPFNFIQKKRRKHLYMG